MQYYSIRLSEQTPGTKIVSAILKVAGEIGLEAKILDKLPSKLPENAFYKQTAISLKGGWLEGATVIVPDKNDASFYHIGQSQFKKLSNKKYFELTEGVSKDLFWY